VPELKPELKKLGREDIIVIVGGVVRRRITTPFTPPAPPRFTAPVRTSPRPPPT
jgi:methylmalonyl-CoA mutase cobalamin-binding subunit